MKAKISALMDGELQDQEFAESMRALREGGEALETWRRYHLISDALRDTTLLSAGFSQRVEERLAAEPTVLAPMRPPQRAGQGRGMLVKAAAAVAAVAFVGLAGMELLSGVGDSGGTQTAKAPVQPGAAEIARVPLPSAARDYLLAHQNYSPRGSLQGMAAYVRTVSDKPSAR